MAEEDPSKLDQEISRIIKEKNKGSEEIEALKNQIHLLTEENEALEKELEKLNSKTEEEQDVECKKQQQQINELRGKVSLFNL